MPPGEIDSLDAKSLKGLVLSLLARIDELLARIAELEGRTGKPPKTPTNSSLPPSSGQKANVADALGTRNRGRKGRPGVALASSCEARPYQSDSADLNSPLVTITNESATKDGKVLPNTRTAVFIKNAKAPVCVPLSSPPA